MILVVAVFLQSACAHARADEVGAAKVSGKVVGLWAVQKDGGKLELVVIGQKDPVTTTVSDATIISGICLHCCVPLEFKTGDSAKNCAACGCALSNAACIAGMPVKSNSWQAMLKLLPPGTGLVPVYNEADKPESGLKRLTVTFRSVLVPVSALDGQTADQLLALVKPLGGIKAELLDRGKLLSVTLKSDWSAERAARLEKALEKVNAKLVVPEEFKTF